MHIRHNGTKFSRAGGLTSGIFTSMSSLIELYQKRVRHNPFLHIALLNNETYSVTRSLYWSCVVVLIFKLFVLWTHNFARPVTLDAQTDSQYLETA